MKVPERPFPKPKASIIRWLLDSDPAIRWQVLRDLTEASVEERAAERARIGREGWGAQLLALQTLEGYWGGAEERETWMGTMRALTVLKDFGLDPSSGEARRCLDRIRQHITWYQLDGQPFFQGETEPCINGRILATGAYFGEPCDVLLERLLHDQLPDGGWNCNAPPSTCASFHSTICVLEGLLEYEKSVGAQPPVTEARQRAEAYLLERRLMRSLRTGEIIKKKWLRFSYPPNWHYDVLRGLDYFRAAAHDPSDARLTEAIDLVYSKQHQNHRWPIQNPYADRPPVEMEGPPGTASRWNTLRALRVLDWAGGSA